MNAVPALGGYFALALDQAPKPRIGLRTWLARGAADSADFVLARDALVWLLRAKLAPGARVWMPDYCCVELARAVARARFRVRLYPVARCLEVDARSLAGLRAGEAAVGVAWFGRPVPATLRRLAQARPEVLWIEDRAQAAAPGPRWAPYAIHSLRKVAGVPDGALLLARDGALPARAPVDRPLDTGFAAPELLRFEDRDGARNAGWYAAFRMRENRLDRASPRSEFAHASRLSRELADRLDARAIVSARRRNYAQLRDALGGSDMAPPASSAWVPFAYPLLTEDAARAQRALARRRIFCARHWAYLSRGAGEFARELSARELSLPIDQRYGPSDMDRLLAALRAEGIVPRRAGRLRL